MKKTLKKLAKVHGRAKLELAASMMKGKPEIHEYVVRGKRFRNLYIRHGTPYGRLVAITAHHDVFNPESDNCLDNNASVYNLVRLNNELEGKELKCGVVIALVDAEEECDPETAGVRQLLERFHPEHLVDLELTAVGGNILQHRYGSADLFDDAEEIDMPLNNAYLAMRMDDFGLKGTVCLSMLDDRSLRRVHAFGECDLWARVHSDRDVVELADADDMRRFRKWLAGHFLAAA